MQKMTNGTEYRNTVNGYVIKRGARTIQLIAKTVNGGELARRLMTEVSFNKLYNHCKPRPILGKYYRVGFVDKKVVK